MTNHPRKRAGNVRRSQDKLELAWRLVKAGGVTKRQLVASGLVSNGTTSTMRTKRREIEESGDPKPLEMSWAEVKREDQIGKLAKQLDAVVAKACAKCPAIVVAAFRRIVPDLPQLLAELDSGPRRR